MKTMKAIKTVLLIFVVLGTILGFTRANKQIREIDDTLFKHLVEDFNSKVKKE